MFARAFEKLFSPNSERAAVNQSYMDFLTEFYRLEAKNYLDKIQVELP